MRSITLCTHKNIRISQIFWFPRAGVLFSLLLILVLLIIICVPSIFSYYGAHQELNTYLLLLLICILFVVGVSIVIFINYQHRQAFKQRVKSEYGILTLNRQRLRRGDSSVNPNDTELQVKIYIWFLQYSIIISMLQKLKLDANSNEKKMTMIKIENSTWFTSMKNVYMYLINYELCFCDLLWCWIKLLSFWFLRRIKILVIFLHRRY